MKPTHFLAWGIVLSSIIGGIHPKALALAWTAQKDDVLKVEFGVLIPSYNVNIKAPPNISSLEAQLEPNSPSKTHLNFGYRNLSLGLSTSNSPNEEKKALYGDSSATDIQFRFFGKRTYEFYYQSYEGYFIKNSEDLDPSYVNQEQKILRPNLKTQNYGLNFYWNLNEEDFSQAVAFDQFGIQKESHWGLSWLVHISRSKIEDPTANFIPATASSDFGDLALVNKLERQTIALGLGVGGIATWAHIYATGLLAVGVGHQQASISGLTLAESSYSASGSYLSLRFGLGYNGEKNVFGLQFLLDGVSSKVVDDGQINGNLIEGGLFYAYRFDGVNIPFLNPISAWFD